MTDRLRCQSCDKPKQSLTRKESALAPWPLNLCRECIDGGLEPRWLIILAVRQFGRNDKVDAFIRKHLYVGPDIAAADIL